MLLLTHLALAAPTWPDVTRAPKGDMAGRHDAAVLIAIENYDNVSDIPGAVKNLTDWQTWLLSTRGVPPEHIERRVNAEATDIGIREALAAGAAEVEPGGTLWVVFIGHGAPSAKGDALFVGKDAFSSMKGLEERSVSRTEVDALIGLGRQSSTVLILDACFSSKGVDGQDLTGEKLSVVRAPPVLGAGTKQTVLSATDGDQYAGLLPGLGRPAYSYLVLGALRGWGDSDGDGAITAGEANRYATGALKLVVMNRRQTPKLVGADVVLGRGAEPKPDLGEISATMVEDTPKDRWGSVGTLDVTAELEGQACDDTARMQAQAAQDAALVAEVKRLQDEASARWAKLGPQAEACTKLTDADKRAGCANVVEAWLAAAEAPATLGATSRTVATKCGERKRAFPAASAAVVVAEASVARGLVAKLKAPPVLTSPTVGTLRWVPPGTFTMGSTMSEVGRNTDEVPHTVTLTQGAYVMEKEVTQGAWQSVTGENPVATKNQFWDGKDQGACKAVGVGDNLPVACVTWPEVVAYANALSKREGLTPAYTVSGDTVTWNRSANGYRLPTEAEWEHAARGGTEGIYAGATTEADLCKVGNVLNQGTDYTKIANIPADRARAGCDDGYAGLAPVGSFRANGYGLYDMSGNVWEWGWDWFGEYTGAATDPTGAATGSGRVNRGGGWGSAPARARVASRSWSAPSIRSDYLGFRLVRSSP